MIQNTWRIAQPLVNAAFSPETRPDVRRRSGIVTGPARSIIEKLDYRRMHVPNPDHQAVEFTSCSVEQTSQVGYHLGELLAAGDVICLLGELGAGKTVLARGVGMGWGALEPVTSPTFTLIHEHHRIQDNRMLYHVDCYRLLGADDAWGIGLEDVLHGDGSVLVEWPEHVQDVLPAQRLWVELEFLDDTRRHVTVGATGPRYEALLQALRPWLPNP
jgi:tRNA threonylcarbamoyladenosine biosynthesis protein TsaE